MRVPYKFVKKLTDQDYTDLKTLYHTGHCKTVRERAHCIILSSKGMSIDEISNILESERDTISSWIDRWEEGKIKGLYDKPRKGAPRKIKDENIGVVENIVNENSNSCRKALAETQKITGITISRSTLKNIIKKNFK